MPPDINAMRSKFFGARRDDVNRQANQVGQEQSDAITRRMAAIGQGGGSGAAIGAQLKASQGVEQQRAAGLNDVAAQEAGANAQAAEAQLGRDFQGGMADKDMAFKRSLFDTEQGNKLKELDLAERNFQLEKDAQEFNKQLALSQAGQGSGGLFGGGGFLGLGKVGNAVSDVGKMLPFANITGAGGIPGAAVFSRGVSEVEKMVGGGGK